MKPFDLTLLFEAQQELDDKVEKKLSGKSGEWFLDIIQKRMLALIVEVCEMANEWRGFKFWSNDTAARNSKMLEEYVDALHFIISLGLMTGESMRKYYPDTMYVEGTITQHILSIIKNTADLGQEDNYPSLMNNYLTLGISLGFTEEQIKTAYFRKNNLNHVRQDTGY